MNRKQITLRIPVEVYEALKNESEKKYITINELINNITYEYFH